MSTRVVLVSCVKGKVPFASPAKDLYISNLFSGMRSYASNNSDVWYILSAEHGLLKPDEIISPYEKTLNKMSKENRLLWAKKVQQQLIELLPPHSSIVILAGERYREGIVEFLKVHGHSVEIPMAGLQLGFQLHWLKENSKNDHAH